MELKTTIKIEATPQKVWNVLTDFENYKNWNPFVKSIIGDVKVGNNIKVELQGMTFKPEVLNFTKNQEFRWKGKLGMKGIFDGEHYFKLNEENGVTLFTHGELFSGILVALFKKKLLGETKDGFIAMNQALKRECEAV